MDCARISLLIRFDALDQQHRFSYLCCQALYGENQLVRDVEGRGWFETFVRGE
jgi:hypothetical protein